jgi:hypothetical protein
MPELTNEERELLQRVMRAHCPERESLVEIVGRRSLTSEEREALRGGLAYELTAAGLDLDSEPTAYGLELDGLIGRLMFF